MDATLLREMDNLVKVTEENLAHLYSARRLLHAWGLNGEAPGPAESAARLQAVKPKKRGIIGIYDQVREYLRKHGSANMATLRNAIGAGHLAGAIGSMVYSGALKAKGKHKHKIYSLK